MPARDCASCGVTNEADARFCEGCGTALERSCAGCGAPASASARFCRACGAPLGTAAECGTESPVRKTVTVMFADLAGSTGFEERVDPETARDVIGRYHELLRSVAGHHRAGVTKYIGDGFMAVWGVPETRADDADRAVEAAVETQECFAAFSERIARAHGATLALRVAVNTGEVVVGSSDADLVGDALNVCARLESECPHGQVVVGEETWRCTRGHCRFQPLGRVQVKGRAAPVAIYQWLGHRVSESAPFVGRSDELRRLHTAFDSSAATRSARLVTVIAEPGVGKSRLAGEFAATRSHAALIEIRCAPEGTAALGPFVDWMRTRDLDADVPAAVAERDRILRGLRAMTNGLGGSVEETFWALRRFIEVLADANGLILILDDIQWADPLLLDFVEHLAEWIRQSQVLMVALTRAELRESRPDFFAVGGWVSDAIRLLGLHPHATAELAASVLGSDRLPPELLSRLPVLTGGNPLFVRELVGMLVHDGVLVGQDDGWHLTIDVDTIAVPPTIQALLASRLERIHAADRRTLEIASVIGTDFSPAALGALAGLRPPEVRASLERLRRLELAQPSGAYSADEPLWRFHHVLVRDVAYRRLLKSDRAELHQRLADWLLEGSLVNAADIEVARHLEAAYGYRCDLGIRDAETADLGLRSARSYLTSARGALDRDELLSAATQAARGAALAVDDAKLRSESLLVGCEALLSARDVAAAAPLVAELERAAGGALKPWASCYRCQYLIYTDPARLPDIEDLLSRAIDEFTRRGDTSGLAKAHRVRASARVRMGRIGDAEADLFEALTAARRSADHRQITAALAEAPNVALWGPSPAAKAGGRCLDVVRMQRMTTAAPSLEATSLRCLGVLDLLRGRPEKARTMLAGARQIVADLGLRHALMETELFAGIIELLAGDALAAEPFFRTALDGLDALGAGVDAGQAAALLARSLLAQGRIEDAEPYAAESERLAGRNLKTAIAWRAVRAEILAAQGRHGAAVGLGREAVSLAADTDLVLDHADACRALSRVLSIAGDRRGSAEANARAEALYAAKGAVLFAGCTTSVGASTAPAPEPDRGTSRLTKSNRASRALLSVPDASAVKLAADCTYDDRRRISGEPIVGDTGFATAAQRKSAQYPHVETRLLAVRGESLALFSLLWRDDSGNESASMDLYEVGEDSTISYWGRFDDDDFTGGFAELERRYYAGEGAPFAAADATFTGLIAAGNRRDLDEVFDRMAGYSWPRLCVGEIHDGILTTLCEFDEQDEDAAFAEAEHRMRGRSARLAIANRASAVRSGVLTALSDGDLDAAARPYPDHLMYEDRRRLAGDPISGRTGMRAAFEWLLTHYRHFDGEVWAVRTERLALGRYRCADDAGNETTGLLLVEVDDDGMIVYEGRFDEDAFDSAYAELERRYYTGEGAAFAQSGLAGANLLALMNLGEFDAMATRVTEDLRVTEHARTGFPDRSSTELRSSLKDLASMLKSVRSWFSALCWMSPTLAVGRLERVARDDTGEAYAWTHLLVTQWLDGQLSLIHSFDIDDEDSAFACAESLR